MLGVNNGLVYRSHETSRDTVRQVDLINKRIAGLAVGDKIYIGWDDFGE